MSLLVGIPLGPDPDQRFYPSLLRFLMECDRHYKIEVCEVKEKPLVEAQNLIADVFVKSDHTHLLLLEDDHWGHSREMLKSLLRTNALISGINYYSRHWPYYSCLMQEVPYIYQQHRFGMTNHKEGCHQVDLVGFAMMLIQKEVFNILDKPYFRLNEFGGKDNYATDINFADRCKEAKIPMIGCFDHILAHREL